MGQDLPRETLALIEAAQRLHYELAEYSDVTGETVAQGETRQALAIALQRIGAPVQALPPAPRPWGDALTTASAYRQWVRAGRPAARDYA